ncbi:Ribosome maturation factor RimM [Enhygromyxa salina]|uniref:Ribosome maturation factor RimM n=1 Tax=Enhygromyxa salina TaxID=215803 RepID=A0A2S9XGF4_9BACT|nr:ribosome maturation factor RimM [Enhygromyxa salina]PRP91761.1 Ribosome maturation factor RimM [Enhygromyxa salina]
MSTTEAGGASPDSFAARHVQLGYVAGAHGLHGALRVKLFNAESTALQPGVAVALVERGGSTPASMQVTRVAPKPGSDTIRLWLQGVDGRDAAEALRGHELWLERASLPALEDDEYYLADLIGLEVVRELDGEPQSLGEITGVITNAAQPLVSVRLRGREWLLPALPPFIVAVETERVLVDVHDDMVPGLSDGGDEPRPKDGA